MSYIRHSFLDIPGPSLCCNRRTMPEPRSGAISGADSTPSFSPLYQQIKALLVKSLQAGEWKPGEAIPSEMELAARFKVSQGTVRKAIDEMAAENLLVRRQGKGTFVATHAEQRTQYRFLRLMPDDGGAAPLQRRLLDCRRMRAPAEVARLLEPEGGEAGGAGAPPAAGRRPCSRGAGRPLAAGALFKGLTAERLAAGAARCTALRGRIRRAHGPCRREDPGRGGDDDAGACWPWRRARRCCLVERLSFTYGDKPVELRRGLYHTERTITATN
jgi:GntR family transcriptional regulator